MIAAKEITANELRIGNWVNDLPIEKGGGGNGYMQVDGMVLSDIGMFDLRPIPLTPEILTACGFEKVNTKYQDNWVFNTFSIAVENNTYWFSDDTSDASCHRVKDVRYLHQLQNLYYALTETELPVLIDVLKSVDTL